jgi:hypothetical protein
VPGTIRTFLYSKPEAFLVKQVGHFPDVSSRLMHAHLDKGDEVRPARQASLDTSFHTSWLCCALRLVLLCVPAVAITAVAWAATH